jgi:hypothetical protein
MGGGGGVRGERGSGVVCGAGRRVCAAAQAIKKSAFGPPANNPYPVILSIEMHCSPRFQDRMFEICDEVFGEDILYLPEDVDHAGMPSLPSPEQLKNKIIFKGKGAKATQDSDDSDGEMPAPAAEGGGEHGDGGKKGKKKSKKNKTNKKDKMFQKAPKSSKKEMAMLAESSKKKPEGKQKASEKWLSLIYLVATKFEGFDKPGRAYEMASYSEGKAKKLCGATRARFMEYNRHQLARIYPWGGRFDSSNLDPSLSWAAGCQLVAFNFQTGDLPMWLNRGRFAENGGLGYVLKPPFMRGTGPPLPPLRLVVTVLSCQRLPNNNAAYDIADTYVAAGVHAGDTQVMRASQRPRRQGRSLVDATLATQPLPTGWPGYSLTRPRPSR